ncbi:homeobox GBX-1 [Paramuricea clavata]|uniref:Homeobox GBX-1 n=1 Tax=Paramuricea clavata TaxID=317549 RepID=A0A6S7GU42_PARCT|nr:homeobox GBX-1 [Paramuricea clavata]
MNVLHYLYALPKFDREVIILVCHQFQDKVALILSSISLLGLLPKNSKKDEGVIHCMITVYLCIYISNASTLSHSLRNCSTAFKHELTKLYDIHSDVRFYLARILAIHEWAQEKSKWQSHYDFVATNENQSKTLMWTQLLRVWKKELVENTWTILTIMFSILEFFNRWTYRKSGLVQKLRAPDRKLNRGIENAGGIVECNNREPTSYHYIAQIYCLQLFDEVAKSNIGETDNFMVQRPKYSEEDPEVCLKQRRRRTAFTSKQLTELEKEFQTRKYLSVEERHQIARELKLSEMQETQVESEGQRYLENINNERFLSDGTDSDSSDDTVKSYNRQATTPVSNTCNTNVSALHDLERRMNQLESELKERIIGMRTEFKTMQETELSIKGQAEYITFLKSQNKRLVMENRELQEKSFNLLYIVSDLNTKLKEAENDKLSLTEIPENAANNHTKAGNTKATGQKETFDGDIRLVYVSKPMPAVETRNRYNVLSDVVAKPSESDASSSEFIEPEKSKTASGMSGQRVNGKNRKSRTTVIISDSE